MAVLKIKIYMVLMLVASVCSSPVSSDREETNSDFEDDPIGYVQDTIEEFIDSFLEQDNYQISEDVEVNRNSLKLKESEARSTNYEDKIERYVETHDVTFKIPFIGKVTIENQNLNNDEVGVNIKFGEENGVEEARKSKLKKILTPILVFILLKAITIIPLLIGVLLLKAFNSLQLSVFAFVISSGLAIFQLCRKIAESNAQAQISAHGPWDAHAHANQGRSLDDDKAQDLAYSAYQ